MKKFSLLTCLSVFFALTAMAQTPPTPDQKSLNVNCGAQVEISATPKTGYIFDHWQDLTPADADYSANPRTITIDANTSLLTYQAIFAKAKYKLYPSNVPDGVTLEDENHDPISFGTAEYLEFEHGTVIYFVAPTINPDNACEEFAGDWSDSQTGQKHDYTITEQLAENVQPFTPNYQTRSFTVEVISEDDSQGTINIVLK